MRQSKLSFFAPRRLAKPTTSTSAANTTSRKAMSTSILSPTDIPTLTALYTTGTLTSTPTAPSPLQTLPNPPRTPAFNTVLSLVKHDITRLRLTAIVNAANTSLLGGGGVDGAIHRAAGPELLEECETLDGCETGDAKITAGYDLPAGFVVHAVGPIYGAERRREVGREERLLAGCYRKSLELVRDVGRRRGKGKAEDGVDGEQQMVSIGFSGLSTGIYGYPKEEAARIAIATVLTWLGEERDRNGGKDEVGRVVFVCFDQRDWDAYVKYLPQFCPPEEGTGQINADGKVDADEVKADEKLDLPDPPKHEPKLPDEPDAKKVKTSHGEGSDA